MKYDLRQVQTDFLFVELNKNCKKKKKERSSLLRRGKELVPLKPFYEWA